MKRKFNIPVLVCVLALLATRANAIDADLGRFSTAKQQQIRDLAATTTNKVPSYVWSFFNAIRVDDYETASNLMVRMQKASYRFEYTNNGETFAPALRTVVWPPIVECYGAFEQFEQWNNRWLHRYGDQIIKSIPPGSVYFGGTDPGRFVISALVESQTDGKPFFILTQNQVADMTYLDYLRSIYGKKIYIPTEKDFQKAFKDYTDDATKRQKEGKLKPGEDFGIVNGRVEIHGAVAVMELSGLIVKQIFNNNPGRQFFVEESYPLDWMYPYLTPHGLIFELHREPLPEISQQETAKDLDYWDKLTKDMLGDWLADKTSIKDVCDFAEKYGRGKHLDDYKGDKEFAANDQARKCYSKLRSSIAGMYAWRAGQAKGAEERDRMYRAADLAFRQSYAICPYSPEAVWRYVALLQSRHRNDDAILIVKTSLHLDPDNLQFQNLLSNLMENK